MSAQTQAWIGLHATIVLSTPIRSDMAYIIIINQSIILCIICDLLAVIGSPDHSSGHGQRRCYRHSVARSLPLAPHKPRQERKDRTQEELEAGPIDDDVARKMK